MIERETLIVGGGPAGSSAAWALRRTGRECLVLDRERFPREKLCAGWITPEVLEDLAFTPADYPHRFLTYDRLHVTVKRLRLPVPAPQHSIRRFEFDRWLLERSDAEVHRHKVRHIERVDDGFVLDGRYRCRYLIGAGGTRCPVFRELFREWAPRQKELQIVTQELEFPCDWQDPQCRLWFLQNGLPGYSWYVPKAEGYLNVGVGGFAQTLKERGDDIKRHWRLLVEALLARGLLRDDPGPPGGYSYYLRPPQDLPPLDGAWVIGDAAGLATRDMGEGIGPAVRSGLHAARAIADGVPYDLGDVAARTSLGRNCLRYQWQALKDRALPERAAA